MVEHEVTALDNFIGGWLLNDLSVCDELIAYHKASPHKGDGVRTGGVDKSRKDSVDCLLQDALLLQKYTTALQTVLEQYIRKYPWCNQYAPWRIVENINIRYYKPTAGYFAWHTERSSNQQWIRDRHLVFMTYLNDVDDGGETEWFHQRVKIQPRKGLTVIWPSDWTFTHRGLTSPTKEKYIITGWLNYVTPL